jgi:iterative type I PKS product template protein
VLTPSDAIYLAGKRSELLEKKLQAGSHGMLAIKASAETIFEKLCYRPEIACINGPSDTVLSGPVTAMSKACEILRSCGVQCTILSIPYGFHSSQVDPILDEFETLATGVNFGKPQIPFISPLLDDIIEDAGVIGPSYLRRQIRETVDFSGSVRRAKARGLVDANSIWVEVGPHPLCIGMVKSILRTEVKAVHTLRKHEESLRSMAKAVSMLSYLGVDNDWIHYHRDYESGQRLLVLPSYCFEEQNYWIERQVARNKPANALESGPATTTVQKLVWKGFTGHNQLSILFESDMSEPDLHAAIVGHSVNGSGLCPASVYADMALTIARYIRDNYELRCRGSGMEITDMTITRPITVPHSRPTEPSLLRMSVSADLNTSHIQVSFGHHDAEKDETEWSAKCTVAYGDAESWMYQWSKHSYLIDYRIKELEQGVSGGTTSKLLRGMVYRLFSSCVEYNLKYQAMQEVLLYSKGLEATALLNLYSGTEGGDYFCSPFCIDALIHLAGFVMNANDEVDTRNAIYISGGWKSMRFAQMIDPSIPYRVHVKMHPAGENSVAGDVTVLQGSRIVAFINDLKFQKVPHALLNIIIPPVVSSKESTIARSSATRVQHPVAHEIVPVQTPERDTYVQTPYDGMLSQVFEVIAEQIGITTQEVCEIDDFAEMGVDSLLSLQIAAEIKERFGLDFDSHLFSTHTTAQKLNGHLAVQVQADRSPAAESMLTSSDTEETLDSSVGTPNSSVEDRLSLLHLIIAEQLGVAVHELFEVQDLSELGLDSLMSIQITTMLQERCGIKVKPDALTGVAMLASIEELTGIRTSLPNVPRFESFAGARYVQQQQQQRQSIVLQGESGHAERTVFLFPDGSGSPAIYSRLGFNPGQRVVALQSPFIRNPQAFELSIEAIAGLWVEEVRKYQQSGPYFLIGYSCGGYYALEAARQLLAAGAEIGHLLLIDSPSPLEYGAMPSSLPTWLSRQGLLGTKGSGNELTQHFVATIQAVGAYCPVPISATAAPFRTTVIWASDGAAPRLDANTEVLPHDVQMSSLTQWLLQRSNATSLDADGWEKLLPGRQIDVRHTPGHHFSVLNLPNVSASLVPGVLLLVDRILIMRTEP